MAKRTSQQFIALRQREETKLTLTAHNSASSMKWFTVIENYASLLQYTKMIAFIKFLTLHLYIQFLF